MKRGFTLIELMAVIVVLGVLATISIISVDKIIKENKEETYKAQIATIEDAARTWGVKHIKELPDNEGEAISVPLLYFKNEGIISKDFKNSKTNKPFNDDLYVNISYEGGKYKYEVAEESGLGTNVNPKLIVGKYIKLDILCKAVTTSTTGNVPNGSFNYGDEYVCNLGDNEAKTFFVLETNGDNVSLIMNANVDSNGKAITPSNIPTNKGLVAWVTRDDYLAVGGTESGWNENCPNCGNSNLGPITAEAALKANTKTWTRLTANQITLPTGQQIATAGGDTKWTENSGISTKLSTWLYDNLNGTTNAVSKVNGYWTSSPTFYASYVWYMFYSGNLYGAGTVKDSNYGIRPVITIPK